MSKDSAELSRRHFIGSAVGGIVAASAMGRVAHAADVIGRSVSATDKATGGKVIVPAPLGRKINYAIVGLGKLAIGEVLPAMAKSQHCRVTALVSGDKDKAQAVAKRYNVDEKNIYNYKNYDTLRENPDVDAVFIILPNAMHAEYTVRAAQAGKHVLCEKPMATNVRDCQNMIDACRAADKKLMIAYRVHYEPYNQTMMQWTAEQKYGPVQFVMADSIQDVGQAKQWRLDRALAGGGSLFDIGIYSLNAARYLTGEEPIEVSAMAYSNPKDPRFQQVEESIAFHLRFPSGALASCTSSYGTAKVNRYRVVGPKGWYGLDPATSYTGLRLFHGHDEIIQEETRKAVNHFAAEMDHFAECIVHDKTPKTPGEEGLKDVRLMHQIYQAANGHQAVRTEETHT